LGRLWTSLSHCAQVTCSPSCDSGLLSSMRDQLPSRDRQPEPPTPNWIEIVVVPHDCCPPRGGSKLERLISDDVNAGPCTNRLFPAPPWLRGFRGDCVLVTCRWPPEASDQRSGRGSSPTQRARKVYLPDTLPGPGVWWLSVHRLFSAFPACRYDHADEVP